MRYLPISCSLRWLIIATFSCTLLLAGACATDQSQPADNRDEATDAVEEQVDQLREQAGDTAAAVREFAYAEQDAFRSWAGEQIESIDAEFETLDDKIAELSEESKARWQATREQLQERREAVQAELDEAMQATEEQWAAAVKSAADSLDDLGRSVSDALRELSADDDTA